MKNPVLRAGVDFHFGVGFYLLLKDMQFHVVWKDLHRKYSENVKGKSVRNHLFHTVRIN